MIMLLLFVKLSERQLGEGFPDDGVSVRQRGPRRDQAVRQRRHHARRIRRVQGAGETLTNDVLTVIKFTLYSHYKMHRGHLGRVD